MKRFWWVGVFIVIVSFCYVQAVKPKEAEIKQLKFRKGELIKEKQISVNEKEDLTSKIQSQNDPAWIEMVLMKELGVVPEGYLKVHFQKQ